MIGVVWLLTPSMTPCWKSHRGTRDFTFEVLIWSIAENRLPARSRLCSGQSTEVTALRWAGARDAVAATITVPSNATHPHRLIACSFDVEPQRQWPRKHEIM